METIKTAAKKMAVSERTIRNYIDDGMLEIVKITRPGKRKSSIRITSESLDSLIEKSTVQHQE